jgi:glycosyltransferase involved in cell wall biosynthesis
MDEIPSGTNHKVPLFDSSVADLAVSGPELPIRQSSSMIKISVVIPVYNEITTIGAVLDRVLHSGFDTEVVVVEDGSTDGTREFLLNFHDPQVKVLQFARNQGNDAALRLGFASTSSPFIFVQDADLV